MPRALIEALAGGTGPGETPPEVKATTGSRVYDAAAWTFLNPLPVNDMQSFLQQTDNTASLDFVLGRAATAPRPVTPPRGNGGSGGRGGGSGPGQALGTLPATGGLGAPLLGLALVAGVGAVVRRRRAA